MALYAVICTGIDNGNVVTKVHCMPPFESKSEGDIWASKCAKLFNDWTFETVPIRETRIGVYEVEKI